MIIELIMRICGWDAIWRPNPNRYAFGVWAGIHSDLVCVHHCNTREDAEKYLSPVVSTMYLSLICALYKYIIINKENKCLIMKIYRI